MSRRVLVIDDDPETTGALRRLLEQQDYCVREENDSMQALAAVWEFQPHVVVLDYAMPQAHGGDVAWQITSDRSLKRIKLIICSGVDPEQFKRRLPPVRIPVLGKPVDTDALLALLNSP